MEFELTHPQKIQSLITLFQHLSEFSSNVNLLFYRERLYMQTMDAAHVSVCELFLPCHWFEKYSVKGDLASGKYIEIGVNVSILSRVLKIINNRILGGGTGSHVRLTFGYDLNSESLDVSIYFTNSLMDKAKDKAKTKEMEKDVDLEKTVEVGIEKKQEYHFELPLVFLSEDRMKIPAQMEYSADFAFSSECFAEMVKNLRVFGNNVRFQCSEDWISLSSHSQDQGLMKIPLKTDELDFFAIEEGAVIDSSFRSSFVLVISQFHKLSKWVIIRLMKGNPIQITYDLEVGMRDIDEKDLEVNVMQARLVFYLAESTD